MRPLFLLAGGIMGVLVAAVIDRKLSKAESTTQAKPEPEPEYPVPLPVRPKEVSSKAEETD